MLVSVYSCSLPGCWHSSVGKCRRFGRTYRYNPQGEKSPWRISCWTSQPLEMGKMVVPKRRQSTANQSRVTSQKSEYLKQIAVEDWRVARSPVIRIKWRIRKCRLCLDSSRLSPESSGMCYRYSTGNIQCNVPNWLQIWNFLQPWYFSTTAVRPTALLKDGFKFRTLNDRLSRPQRPRGLWRGSAAAHLLGQRVRIPPGAHWCLFIVSVVCCQSSMRRADHSSRGVLPSVVCLRKITKPQQWRGLGPLEAVALW